MPSDDNIVAPKVDHLKHKIIWSDEGIKAYQNLLSLTLPPLELEYSDVKEPEVASVLFQVTSHILTEAAKATNKYIELGKNTRPRKPIIPSEIRQALKNKGAALKILNKTEADNTAPASAIEAAKRSFREAKAFHQNLIRITMQVLEENK